jgi:uncharacterized RmlC-like cupin family protein
MSQSRVLFLEAHAETSGVSFRIKNARERGSSIWNFSGTNQIFGDRVMNTMGISSPDSAYGEVKIQFQDYNPRGEGRSFVIPRKYSGPQASVTLPSLHGDNPS